MLRMPSYCPTVRTALQEISLSFSPPHRAHHARLGSRLRSGGLPLLLLVAFNLDGVNRYDSLMGDFYGPGGRAGLDLLKLVEDVFQTVPLTVYTVVAVVAALRTTSPAWPRSGPPW